MSHSIVLRALLKKTLQYARRAWTMTHYAMYASYSLLPVVDTTPSQSGWPYVRPLSGTQIVLNIIFTYMTQVSQMTTTAIKLHLVVPGCEIKLSYNQYSKLVHRKIHERRPVSHTSVSYWGNSSVDNQLSVNPSQYISLDMYCKMQFSNVATISNPSHVHNENFLNKVESTRNVMTCSKG